MCSDDVRSDAIDGVDSFVDDVLDKVLDGFCAKCDASCYTRAENFPYFLDDVKNMLLEFHVRVWRENVMIYYLTRMLLNRYICDKNIINIVLNEL